MRRDLVKKRAFGYNARPFFLGYYLALMGMVVGFVDGDGALHGSNWAALLAATAGFTLILLTYAVKKKSPKVLLWCYQLLFAMFVYRAIAVVIVEPYDVQAAILSAGWASIAGGSYIIHRDEIEREDD